jgi:hypothetical protein
VPRLEVHNLGAADAEQNSQHLVVGDPLGERGVYAGASLLDPSFALSPSSLSVRSCAHPL